MARIELGDFFRHKGFAGPTYIAEREHLWHGKRHIVGWYQHAPNQRVGIDLPEDELQRVEEPARMWRANGEAVADDLIN